MEAKQYIYVFLANHSMPSVISLLIINLTNVNSFNLRLSLLCIKPAFHIS